MTTRKALIELLRTRNAALTLADAYAEIDRLFDSLAVQLSVDGCLRLEYIGVLCVREREPGDRAPSVSFRPDPALRPAPAAADDQAGKTAEKTTPDDVRKLILRFMAARLKQDGRLALPGLGVIVQGESVARFASYDRLSLLLKHARRVRLEQPQRRGSRGPTSSAGSAVTPRSPGKVRSSRAR